MILYLVIPCYNEEEMLPIAAPVIREKLETLIAAGAIDPQSRALFVNDGSKDKTWELLERLAADCPLFAALKLSRNCGQQSAALAGMEEAARHADAAITMDVDLQEDIGAIDGFVEKYKEGCDVVYGVRNKRETDAFLKRSTAVLFYKTMNWLGVKTVYNHSEYRLMSRRAIEGLARFTEVNLFLRGVVPLIGYRSDYVYYDRNPRVAGETKYSMRKLMALAIDGITSFSVRPLRMITTLGLAMMLLSLAGLLYVLISKLVVGAPPGWAAIVASIWLLGGIQLLCVGVLGEYIGKIYSEVKRRPRFFVEERRNVGE